MPIMRLAVLTFMVRMVSELRKSLIRLAELGVDILLPGHNQIVKGLPKGYILKTAKQWEPYLK